MVEVTFSESFWEDLASISDYIARDSPRYAEEFTWRIVEQTEQLVEFPNSGRIVPEFNNKNLRELILGNYRIVYRIYHEHKIVVLLVTHGAKPLM